MDPEKLALGGLCSEKWLYVQIPRLSQDEQDIVINSIKKSLLSMCCVLF